MLRSRRRKLFRIWRGPCHSSAAWVVLQHDCLALMRQRLPDFFRDERHEGMQQPHHGFKVSDKRLLVLVLRVLRSLILERPA